MAVTACAAEQPEIADLRLQPLVDRPTHQRVEECRGHSLEHAFAIAADPLGGDDVVALSVEGDHLREQFGRILEVGIHDDDRVARGEVEARGDRRLVAEVPAEAEHLHPRVELGRRGEDRSRLVAAAVVDVEDLELAVDRFQR